jgi:glycosyltransferase involved in cell wall biosynthesis
VDTAYADRLLDRLDEAHRKQVDITGPLHGSTLWAALHGARFNVQPARWYENMPNTLLEALSLGQPVIASRIGSLTELVDDGVNGLLVDPGDSTGLARAMTRLALEPETAAAMGRAARDRYLRDHTPARHRQHLTAILEEVMAATP